MSDDELMGVAVAAVARAGRVCQAVRATLGDADRVDKSDRSPVTVADFAAQAVVAAALQDAGLPMVAEEDADDFRAADAALRRRVVEAAGVADEAEAARLIDAGAGEPAGTYWVLDPIDGTKGFLRGGHYAVALALVRDGRVVLGVLGCPAWDIGRLFGGRPGEVPEAWAAPFEAPEQKQPITVAGPRPPRRVESVESAHSDHDAGADIARAIGAAGEVARMDSQAKYAAVACGEADVYLRLPTRPGYEEKVWDHAAGLAVVEAAGGRVTDLDGRPLDFTAGRTLAANRGVVATSAAGDLHEKVLAAAAGR